MFVDAGTIFIVSLMLLGLVAILFTSCVHYHRESISLKNQSESKDRDIDYRNTVLKDRDKEIRSLRTELEKCKLYEDMKSAIDMKDEYLFMLKHVRDSEWRRIKEIRDYIGDGLAPSSQSNKD